MLAYISHFISCGIFAVLSSMGRITELKVKCDEVLAFQRCRKAGDVSVCGNCSLKFIQNPKRVILHSEGHFEIEKWVFLCFRNSDVTS